MKRGQHWLRDILHPYNGWGKLWLSYTVLLNRWKLWSFWTPRFPSSCQENFYTLQDLKLFRRPSSFILQKTWFFSQDQRHHVKSNQLLCGREKPNWHHENLQQNIKCWSWHTQVPSDSSHSSTSASLSTVSTCVVVKSNATSSGGGTCHKHHPCCQMVGEIAHLYLKCLVHCVTDTWCADVRQTTKCRTRRN
jgi:hypothetical protein